MAREVLDQRITMASRLSPAKAFGNEGNATAGCAGRNGVGSNAGPICFVHDRMK